MRSYPNLQMLVGAAGLDRTLCARLLNGNRRQVILDFKLSAEEQEAVLAARADSLHEFAQALLDWIEYQNEGPTEVDECADRTPARSCIGDSWLVNRDSRKWSLSGNDLRASP
jgi:hypothetical protein